ncbi:hypothetical protein [Salinisphaera sp. T31B1]|uniref:hypothetical protein n=1 Tax=Salinisphaera sp. T31B1 TaxID=727963 RepID=UPI00333F6647
MTIRFDLRHAVGNGLLLFCLDEVGINYALVGEREEQRPQFTPEALSTPRPRWLEECGRRERYGGSRAAELFLSVRILASS